ncbi:hypothetical protein [Altericista sp. CCNU0014]|uniref:hypothetical protein n=1 Tax=Altericista sp. CCNU0014 TaxID=3082949 RepID=UPI003850104C
MTATFVEISSDRELLCTITRLASQVIEGCRQLDRLVILGILTHGLTLATLLAQQIVVP